MQSKSALFVGSEHWVITCSGMAGSKGQTAVGVDRRRRRHVGMDRWSIPPISEQDVVLSLRSGSRVTPSPNMTEPMENRRPNHGFITHQRLQVRLLQGVQGHPLQQNAAKGVWLAAARMLARIPYQSRMVSFGHNQQTLNIDVRKLLRQLLRPAK